MKSEEIPEKCPYRDDGQDVPVCLLKAMHIKPTLRILKQCAKYNCPLIKMMRKKDGIHISLRKWL